MPKKTFSQRRAIEAAKAESEKSETDKPAEPIELGFGSFKDSGFANHPHRQRVEIHHYNPTDEVIARACGMAYGQVYVGGCSEGTRSHEFNDMKDERGFIPREQVRGELIARRIERELAAAGSR